MKTLIVSYLPSQNHSKTKRLLDSLTAKLDSKNIEFEHLDLLKDTPDVFDVKLLTAYVQRNFMGQKLSEEQKSVIAKMDRMTKQFKNADIIVLAFPMYNFSFPAVVKAYFDSVMQKGETWDMDDSGYVGLLKGKKALVLMASGGVYDGDMASFEHALSLARVEFGLMGFDDIRTVTAAGVNMMPEKIEEIIKEGTQKIDKIVDEWY